MVKSCLLFFLLILFSCGPTINNKQYFSLKEDVYIDDINTKGYYYSIHERGDFTEQKGKLIHMYVFLENGYFKKIKNGYGNKCGDTVTLECEIKMSEFMLEKELYMTNDISEMNRPIWSVWDWGKYKISNDSITMQWFYNRFGNYYLVEQKGYIIDQQTIKINFIKDYRTNKIDFFDETLFFSSYDISNLYNLVPKKIFSKIY